MKKYEIVVNGEKITLEDKSHAGIFRQFWAYFLNLDFDKTIETIEKAGIRTSESEYFTSTNGGKKKNIFVKEGYWIYTHLNPAAMEKAYSKFISAWEGIGTEVQEENPIKEMVPKLEGHKPKDKPKLKNIYKKTLAIDLIKLGNDLHHTMRNRANEKYQVFVFHHTEKLDRDIAELTGYEYQKDKRAE